jgi:hypothetical protein
MDSHPASQEPQMQMPQYQSHKKVWALQIKEVFRPSSSKELVTVSFVEADYAPIQVESEVCSRYWPREGDYYLVYEDGYQSISPRKAFEEGYTKL